MLWIDEDAHSMKLDWLQSIKIEDRSFDLPGNPTVFIDASTSSSSDLTTRLWIVFQNNELNSSYDAYFKALKKSYGNPFHIRHESLGKRTARWVQSLLF